MPTYVECVCCCEYPKVVSTKEADVDEAPKCITDHPRFTEVCLSVFALKVAYYQYKQEWGANRTPKPLFKYAFYCNEII